MKIFFSSVLLFSAAIAADESTLTADYDLPLKAYQIALGEYTPYAVITSSSVDTPLQGIMIDVLANTARIAHDFGFKCTATYGVKMDSRICVNIKLKDAADTFLLRRELQKEVSGNHSTNNSEYPICVSFGLSNHSKINDVFNFLSIYFSHSEENQTVLTDVYGKIKECAEKCVTPSTKPSLSYFEDPNY